MPVPLPTDTQHLRLETRQYELFNRPLGQGIPRRTLYLGAAVFTAWFTLLLTLGLSPLSRLGPFLFIVPPFAVVFLGTKPGDDGRINLMRWYDALFARTPARRRLIRNPLLAPHNHDRGPIRVDGRMTEIHSRGHQERLVPLLSHRTTTHASSREQR
jgi:hypothetical protein